MTTQHQDMFRFLQQEGYLIQACLCCGLNELRKAHVGDPGKFYLALLNLSVGLERLLKVCLITEHAIDNDGKALSKNEMKKLSHKIAELYDTLAASSSVRGCPLPRISALQPPTDDIIRLLTEFATESRYHNLDSVAGSVQTTDPLDRWNSILVHVIKNDLSASLRKKLEANAKSLDDILDGKVMVRMNSLDGKKMTLQEALLQPVLHMRGPVHHSLHHSAHGTHSRLFGTSLSLHDGCRCARSRSYGIPGLDSSR